MRDEAAIVTDDEAAELPGDGAPCFDMPRQAWLALFRDLAEGDGAAFDTLYRAVGAALRALARPPAPDIWSLIWRTRPLRVAWGCSVASLLVANLAVWRHHGAAAPATARSQVQPVFHPDRELSAIVDLPRIDANVRGFAGFSESARPAGRGLQPVPPTATKRKDSQS